MKLGFSQQEIQDTVASLELPEHPFYMRRTARALDLVNQNKVHSLSREVRYRHTGRDDIFRVDSQFDNKHYHVELNHGNVGCSCPDNRKNPGTLCKHMIAATIYSAGVAVSNFPKKEHQEQPVKVTYDDTEKSYHKRGRWWVTDYKDKVVYIIYRDKDGGLHCPCERGRKRKDCEHKKAVRDYLNNNPSLRSRTGFGGNGSKITNECGSEHAKALQDKMNGQSDSQGNNGNGAHNAPSQQPQLDISDPFQECEQLDIDQIEGRLDGELVHRLSNGEYVSYRGIMKLAEKHNIDFPTIIQSKQAVIAYAQTNGSLKADRSALSSHESEKNPRIVTRLRAGIDSGADLSTVELDD